MSNTSTLTRVSAGFLGLAVGLFLLAGAFAVPAKAQTDLQAQIDALLAQIATLQSQIASLTGGGGGGTGYTFTTNLKQGDTGEEVRQLQMALNTNLSTQVAATGAGSPGGETSYFGGLTKAAVVKFQELYAADVLTPLGLSAGTGFWGPSSRAKMNDLMAQMGDDDDDVVVDDDDDVDYEGNLTVSAASTQPANGLAIKNAARVPFTKIVVTAGSSGATIDSITVERGGASVNSDISGAVVLDENGTQLGIQKSLNSNNQAVLTEDISVPPNSSRTLTIGANMPALPGAGNVVTLSVVDVAVKGGSVTGSFPITGAMHTTNIALSIGSVSVTALNHTSATKEIGTQAYTFSSFRLSNGSVEKVRVKSLKWNMTGSASADDLTNVVVWVEGTEYPVTVSSDGKYYTAVLGNGIVMDKGNSVEIRVKGDIEGGSGRTVIFDIHRTTDLNIVGETYGQGITPPAGSGTAATTNNVFTAVTPWLDGAQVTIGGGSITVSKALSVEAQNISENVADQVLGGFDVEVKGEPVSVGSITFYWQNMHDLAAADGADLTNVRLVKEDDGTVVAGPIDGTTTGQGSVAFSDTVVFPVEKATYVLQGKVGTDFANNESLIASTTPSSDWSTVTGQITGDTITPAPAVAVAANQVTVKSGSLTVSVSSVPLTQTIVAGGPFTFANLEFNTTQSGDDIRVSSIPIEFNGAGFSTDLTNCTLLDGTEELVTGTNRVSPTARASGTTFTFDEPYVFPKGVVTTLGVSCETSGTGAYQIGLDSSTSAGAGQMAPTAEGSGESITETINDSPGQTITLTTGGTYSVVENNTPGYNIVTPGTEVVLLQLKFSATNEDIDIKRVAFQLAETASNTPSDLVGRELKLYNGSAMIGTAQISESTGTEDFATSTAIVKGDFRVPKSGTAVMTVKGTIAGISADAGPLQRSGDLLKVTWDAHDANATTKNAGGNYGTGVNGGLDVVPSTTSDIAQGTGVGRRIMKAYPTFTKIDLSSSERQLVTGSDRTLYKFKVSTNGGEVSFYKFTFDISSSSAGRATTSLLGLYAFTDSSFSQADTTFSTDGLLNAGSCFSGWGATSAAEAETDREAVPTGHTGFPSVEIYMDKTSCNTATTTYEFTGDRWFELRGTISTVDTASGDPKDSIEVGLMGDAAYPVNSITWMSEAKQGETDSVDADTNDDLIWSPRSTSTSASMHDLDWTNGYQVPGVPTTNMSKEIFTEP